MKKSDVDLTDSKVAKMKATGAKYNIWDRACPGFGVEVKPSGTRIFVVKTCITAGGVKRRQWHTLGHWPLKNVVQARAEAVALKDQVRKGEDPKALIMARREAVRMNEFLDRYYEEHLQVKVTLEGKKLTVVKIGKDATGLPEGSKGKEPARSIERFIRPVLGGMAVRDIGTADIADLLFRIRKNTPIQANRLRSVLLGIFAKAEIWELRPIGSNPVPVQERAPESHRERNLSDQEIARLGATIRSNELLSNEGRKISDPWRENPYAVAAIRLALLAGMRKGEVLGLRWDWVHLDDGEIRIPAGFHKSGKKTQKIRVVRLCAAARAILKSLPRALGNPYVIVGDLPATHLVDLNGPWRRLRVTAGLAVAGKPADEDVTIHDLRRTYSSVAARLEVPELFIGALLGHAVVTVTQVYARVSQDPLREYVETIGARIAGFLSGEIDLDKEAEEAQAKRKGSKLL